MKKYLLYTLCLCSALCLGGCKEDDLLSEIPSYQAGNVTPWGTQVQDPEPDNPYPLYIFPALDPSQPDFAFHLASPNSFRSTEEFLAAPGYSNRLLVVAIYSAMCTGCREQALYFDRLAQEFAETRAEFIVLFVDRDKDEVNKLPWVKDIKYAKVHYNAYDFCQNGICINPVRTKTPLLAWIVDSKSKFYVDSFPTDPTDQSSWERIYNSYVHFTQQLLNPPANGVTVQVDEQQHLYVFQLPL